MRRDLLFYFELNIVKTLRAFKRYACSYSFEVKDSKDASVQLAICRPCIKDLLKDLSNKIKGFMSQIMLKVLSSKYKENTKRDLDLVCFNSTTKTLISSKGNLQEIFNRIDKWIGEGSSWVIESIDSKYINVFIWSHLWVSSYIKLFDRLTNSKNGLINIKNNDKKCFLWCHIKPFKPIQKEKQN